MSSASTKEVIPCGLSSAELGSDAVGLSTPSPERDEIAFPSFSISEMILVIV